MNWSHYVELLKIEDSAEKAFYEKECIYENHVTLDSISARREFFLGKPVSKIEKELHRHGYQTRVRGSIHATSKARIIVVTNATKERNISQVQVSPKSKRHGDVPYVKISTTDCGRIKIIGTDPEHYKTDGKEKAILLFRRKRK